MHLVCGCGTVWNTQSGWGYHIVLALLCIHDVSGILYPMSRSTRSHYLVVCRVDRMGGNMAYRGV